MNTYTPIWNYIASGLNFLISKEIWNIENDDGIKHHKIPEGVRLVLVITCASVVEGSLKTYLKEIIDGALYEKNRIEETMNSNEENSGVETKGLNRPFFETPTKQELLDQKHENDKLLIKIKNVTIEEVENATWNTLIGLFEKVTGNKLRNLLEEKRKDLFADVEAIFHFRNFIVHSNSVQHQIIEENNIFFQDKKSERLISYLKKNRLIGNYKNGKEYFIEYLMPEKLIHHFKKTLDEYLDVNFFKDYATINTSTSINLIYNG
jgi:hypothetical protein